VIHNLLIVAAISLAPAPLWANAIEIMAARPAESPSGPVIAQNTAAPADISGTYAGKVDRQRVGGEPRAARAYRLTMNPDMNTGKVLIYDLDGKLLNEIGLVGKMTDDRTFEGKTMVINASPTYKPDNVRLVFAPDRGSVAWYHNDGSLEGAGMLSRSVE
jgi:hypothetical protein